MTIETPSLPGLLPPDEARSVHAGWSELNAEFLDYVAQHPEYLERGTFDALRREHWLRKLRHQSWPLFVGPERLREVEAMTLGIDRLVKEVVQRFVDEGPARFLERYRPSFLDERNVAILLREPVGIRSAYSRGDYIEGREGLKCLEYNAGAGLGGLQYGVVGELYLANPPVARFLEAKGRTARSADTLGHLFRHVVDETLRLGVWRGGDFNVALVNRPHPEEEVDLRSGEMYDAALQRVLAERGMTGAVLACGTEDFGEEGEALVVGGRPVHVVIQMHGPGGHLRFPFRCSKMGRVNFIIGPIGAILSDKRNLAFLSANAHSDEFTAEERDLIERHIPWTRVVRPERTTFRGRPLRLPDGLVEHRDELVLKRAASLAGRDVRVGRFRTDAEWREDVARAAQEEDWVVQEYVEPVPHWLQHGERGAARYDVVWGLFAFGGRFGAPFLRMQPHGTGTGVVNTERGAEEGVCLIVDD